MNAPCALSHPTQLAIFDVDGTLTNTNHVDALCYIQAVADEFGVEVTGANWSEFTAVTDVGITLQIFRERLERSPTAEELSRLQDRFKHRLEESRRQNPALFAAVAGAPNALERLQRDAGWAVAIATGCWRVSACLKLEAARINIEGIPAAFAEDGISREEIVGAALARSRDGYGTDTFSRVVSVADAPWDIRAALHLNLPFVGVGNEQWEVELRTAGATHVMRDFTDFDLLLRALEEARVPTGSDAAR